MKTKLIEDKPDRYILHDGVKPFPVFKHGLSEATHRKIQALAKGGVVHAMTGPKPRPIGRDTYTPRADKTRVEVEAGEPTITSRNNSGAHVEVQAGEPLITSRSSDHVVASDDDRDELSVQMADGGTVPRLSVDDMLPDSPEAISEAVSPTMASFQPQIGPTYAPALLAPAPPYVEPPRTLTPLEDLRAQPGFDEAAYQNALKGKYPKDGPEAYQATRQRAAQIDTEAADKAAADALGIRRKGSDQGPTDDAPSVAPTRPTRPTGGGAGLGPLPTTDTKEYDASVEAEKAAARGSQAVAAEGARNLAVAEGERQKQLAANQLEQRDMMQRAHAESAAMLAKIQASSDAMVNQDMTVDPGRYWASKSTGGKISGIIGLVLGAFGTGPDGVNKAAQMIDRSIDRDIDAQKAEHDLRLRKGQAAIAAATSMYGLHHQTLQDDIAARAAAKATGDEIAISKLEQIKASTASASAGPQADALIAKLSQNAAMEHQTVKDRAADVFLKRAIGQSEIAKNYAEAGKAAVGGGNPAEVKEQHTAEASAQNSLDLIKKIQTRLADTQSYIPGKTAINQNVGKDAAALGADQTALVLELKNVAKLGQISAGDQALLDRLTGDPQAFFTSEGSKVAKLNALKDIVLRSVKNQRNAIRGVQAAERP